jgi:hypothetical protein
MLVCVQQPKQMVAMEGSRQQLISPAAIASARIVLETRMALDAGAVSSWQR